MGGRPKKVKVRIRILQYLAEKDPDFVPASNIARVLRKSPATITYYIKELEKEGLVIVNRIGRRTFLKISEKGKHALDVISKNSILKKPILKNIFSKKRINEKKLESDSKGSWLISKNSKDASLGVSGGFLPRRVRLHDYKVKLYLDVVGDDDGSSLFSLSDNRDVNYIVERYLSSGVIKRVVKRFWDAVYFSIPLDVDVTLEATTRAVIIHFHSKEFDFSWDVLEKLQGYIYTTIAHVIQYIVTHTPLRVVRVEAINMHLGFLEGKFFDNALPKRLQVSVEFPRKAVTPNGLLKQRAKTWYDRSFGELEREMNDQVLARLYLLMPVKVAALERKVDVLAQATARIVDILEKMIEPRRDDVFDLGYDYT